MILLNSVFAGYEIALASIGVARLDTLVKQHRHGAASALRMKKGMEGSLAVVQLGITLVGAIAAATGGAGAEESIEPLLRSAGLSGGWAQFAAIALVVLPLTVVMIIVGELVPKVFALRNQEWVCLQVSPAMEVFALCVKPAVWFLESSVRVLMRFGERFWKPKADGMAATDATLQELRAIAALARTSRLIGHREEGIIVSAGRLSKTPLRAIMLPADSIGMLAATDTLSEALISAHQDMHTRFPVSQSRGDPQQIVGYVNFKDIVSTLRLNPESPSLLGILRKLPRFHADQSVAMCLESLIREHNHIALIQDTDGKILGMVTMEDILEELVGEIHDEYDRLPSYVTPVGNGWIVGGNTSLSQLKETAGIDLPPMHEKPLHTVNDWIASRLGQPPAGGEQFTHDSLRVTVRKVRRHLVQEAHIAKLN
jgi:putative hemolysin